MGWYLRKSLRIGPVRFNLSKRGVGVSAGVKGLRVGTGPNGPYVAGGRGGIYFRQRLGGGLRQRRAAPDTRTTYSNSAYPPVSQPGSTPTNLYNQGAGGSQPPTPFTPHHYPTWLLISLIAAYVVMASTIAFAPDFAVFLLLAVQITVLALDWRGFVSLNGRMHWQRMNLAARIFVGYFYFGAFYITLGVYLGIEAYDWLKTRRDLRLNEPMEQKRRIAELEAQMGMLPRTEGVCRECHKPLQIGADWCAYCGASVIERPRVCPVCAATTLPDARFCPQCRTELPGFASSTGGVQGGIQGGAQV